MHQLIQKIEKKHIEELKPISGNAPNSIQGSNVITFQTQHENFKVGDEIIVHVKIPEKNNTTRIQKFTGRCIGIRKPNSTSGTVKVLKLEGTKVLRIFPIYSPVINITVKIKGHARRAKLNYLINRSGKSARIVEKKIVKQKK